MKPANLEEWAQALRIGPDVELADYASEILELIADAGRLEFLEDVAADIHHRVLPAFPDDTAKALDWILNREELLGSLEEILGDAGRGDIDPDDAVKALLVELEELRTENEALKAPKALPHQQVALAYMFGKVGVIGTPAGLGKTKIPPQEYDL